MDVTDLNYNPMLKELLIKYISRQYEENALYDDDNLYHVYKDLKTNNKLNNLFMEERLTTKFIMIAQEKVEIR